MARIIRGEPLTRPRSKEAKALSLSALRLLAYGQQYPEETFDSYTPWGVCPLDYLMILGICRGLVKRGLLTGDPPTRLRITPAGAALDVTQKTNWKPIAPPSIEVLSMAAGPLSARDEGRGEATIPLGRTL